MIKAIIGGIGSGKTLSTVKYVYNRNNHTFVNFGLRLPKVHRLKKSHIIKDEYVRTLRSGRDLFEKKVNWDFWEKTKKKYKTFDIVIDEIHNIFNSRRSQTKDNVKGQEWIAQIRKVLSGNEKNDLIVVSQRLSRVDVSIRDLLHEIIFCKKYVKGTMKTKTYFRGRTKIEIIPKFYIMQYHFKGNYCLEKYQYFLTGQKSFDKRTYFLGNPFIQFYDSYEIINFNGDYL